MRRFFAVKAKDHSGRLAIEGEDARHIQMVLRKKPGDKLDIVLPEGEPATCAIVGFEDGSVMLEKPQVRGFSLRPPSYIHSFRVCPRARRWTTSLRSAQS